jgi:hypothetical protein
MTNDEIPSSKFQVPSSKEIPSRKIGSRLRTIEAWNFFGTWDLELGTLRVHHASFASPEGIA